MSAYNDEENLDDQDVDSEDTDSDAESTPIINPAQLPGATAAPRSPAQEQPDPDQALLDMGAQPYNTDHADADKALKALGALTPEEHASGLTSTDKPTEDLSTSLLHGVEQGGTLGFADELGAAMATGMSGLHRALGGKVGDENQSLADLYKEYRDLNRARYKKSEEANPKTYMAGQLAGGLLVPMGEAGALQDASMLDKIKSGMEMGGRLGALTSAGSSDAEMNTPEFAKDVIGGTVAGGVGGAALTPAIAAVKGAGSELAGGAKFIGNKLFGDVGNAASVGFGDMGVGGIKATTDAGKQAILNQTGEFGNSVAPVISKVKDLATLKNEVIKAAEDAGVRINNDDINNIINKGLKANPKSNLEHVYNDLEKFKEMLNTAKNGRIINQGSTDAASGMKILDQRSMDRDLTKPSELYQLQKDMQNQSMYGDNSMQSPEGQGLAKDTMKNISSVLKQKENIPQLENIDNGITAYNRAADAIGIPDTKNIDEGQVRDKILSLLGQEGKINVSGVKAQEKIKNFLTELSKVNKPMADKIAADFPSVGQNLDTLQQIHQPWNFLSPLGATRSASTGVANLTGYYAGKAVDAVATPSRAVVSKIGDITPDFLKQTAQTLSNETSPALKGLSNVLNKAADADERSRNATLFGLLQNPAYRQILLPNANMTIPNQQSDEAK